MRLPKPEFHLARVDDTGTHDIEIVSVAGLTLDVKTDRRGFLGAALTASSALAAVSVSAQPGKPPAAGARKPAPRLSPKDLCESGFAHESMVRATVITPDGKTLISGSDDGAVKLWNLANAKVIKTFKAPSVRALALSADGSTLAVGTNSQVIELRSLPDGAVLHSLRSDEFNIHALAFSPDGKTLASAARFRSISLWDAAQGTALTKLQGHDKGVAAVAISADGKALLSGAGTELKVWVLPSGKVIRSLDGHRLAVNCVAISPDGITLASGASDQNIMLWRMPDEIPLNVDTILNGAWLKSWFADKPIATLQGHIGEVRAVAFSPDGKLLASGSTDSTVKLWDLPEGALRATLSGHKGAVVALAFSPDNKLLSSGSEDKTVRLWQLPQGTLHGCLLDVKPPPPKPPAQSRPPGSSGSSTTGGSYSYCSCNKVCVCIPVRCQAHRLLHEDPVVRTMAREILLLVGTREFA